MRAAAALGAALFALWLLGAVQFLLADGSVDYTLPRRERPPREEHNLASYLYGPRVRASSYHRDPVAHHHPMFLVDALPESSLTEKWVSGQRDRKPWFSVMWREPRTLSRVRLTHGGLRERPWDTSRNYRLRCLTAQGDGRQLVIKNNRAHITEHPLACPGALGLRIDFVRGEKDDTVRLFEVEAWGR